MHHVNAGKQANREQDIHRGTGDGDQKPVPPRVRHEFCRIAAAFIHRVLAAHLDVAAERQRVDAIVGLAFSETEQALAEADGKLLNPNSQQLGHRISGRIRESGS